MPSTIAEWLEKGSWTFEEAAYLLIGACTDDPSNISNKDYLHTRKIMKLMQPKLEAKHGHWVPLSPVRYIEIAHDCGIVIWSMFRDFYMDKTGKELSYSENSSVKEEFRYWAKLPSWTSTEALILLSGGLPKSELPQFQSRDINEKMADHMERSVIAGQLKPVAPDVDAFAPTHIVEWAKENHFQMPRLLAESFGLGRDLIEIKEEDIAIRESTESKPRGRPSLNWTPFHIEMAKRAKDGTLPVKQESCIADMQEFFEKLDNSKVARSTLVEKISPYYDEFVRK